MKQEPTIKKVKKSGGMYCVTHFVEGKQKQEWFSDETDARHFWQEKLAEEAGEGEEVKG